VVFIRSMTAISATIFLRLYQATGPGSRCASENMTVIVLGARQAAFLGFVILVLIAATIG